jgi:hypothetical protein
MLAHPLVRGATQSGVIHFFADVFAQGLETNGEAFSQNRVSNSDDERSDRGWDYSRTMKFALVGLTLHGPYFGLGFARVDAYFGPVKGLAQTMKKTIATQLILNPPYLVLLFAWMGVLEGRKWPDELIANTVSDTRA